MARACASGKNEEVIKLNVGGKLFQTFLSTLDKEVNCILASAALDETTGTGVYHIDSCPKEFKVILGWLRFGLGLNQEKLPAQHIQNVAKSFGIIKTVLYV